MKSHATLAIAVLAASTLACQVVIADDCDQTAPREATLDAAGATRVVVEVGAGSLDVRGAAGAGELRAHGTACASSSAVLDDVRLVAERRGDTLYVKTEFPRSWNGQARLDLEIDLPAGLAVEVDDGSGSIAVRGVASLRIEDGSGSIDISGVGGSVLIRSDGSGSIRVADVRGDFTVERDGSGGIHYSGVDGEVSIPRN